MCVCVFQSICFVMCVHNFIYIFSLPHAATYTRLTYGQYQSPPPLVFPCNWLCGGWGRGVILLGFAPSPKPHPHKHISGEIHNTNITIFAGRCLCPSIHFAMLGIWSFLCYCFPLVHDISKLTYLALYIGVMSIPNWVSCTTYVLWLNWEDIEHYACYMMWEFRTFSITCVRCLL